MTDIPNDQPTLALHFTVPPGVDPKAVAAEFERQMAAVAGVDSAEARADQRRSIGPQEIVLYVVAAKTAIEAGKELIETTTAGAEASAKLLEALRHVVEKAKKLAHACGLGAGRLEAGMKQVPLEAVGDAELHAAAAG